MQHLFDKHWVYFLCQCVLSTHLKDVVIDTAGISLVISQCSVCCDSEKVMFFLLDIVGILIHPN